MSIKLKKKIAARLKQLREYLQISQKEMALKLYLKKDRYRKYESGENRISIETLSTLSIDLNTSLDWLISNRGQMFVDEEQVLEPGEEPRDFNNEVKELFYVMKHLPLVRYAVMGFYQKFKLDNQEYINSVLEKFKVKNPGFFP
jgi:transcriptional regulator with XRE-family HTH domain